MRTRFKLLITSRTKEVLITPLSLPSIWVNLLCSPPFEKNYILYTHHGREKNYNCRKLDTFVRTARGLRSQHVFIFTDPPFVISERALSCKALYLLRHAFLSFHYVKTPLLVFVNMRPVLVFSLLLFSSFLSIIDAEYWMPMYKKDTPCKLEKNIR